MNTQQLYSELVLRLTSAESGLGPATPRIGTMGVLTKFLEVVKSLFTAFDLSTMSEEDFLSVVSLAFDTMIAPMLAGTGPLIVMIAKPLCMSMASRYYKNHVKKT